MNANATNRGVWAAYHRRWMRLKPPLRPNDEVVEAFKQAIGPSRRTLLLGVTPELADIAPDVTAVDYSPTMIANIWPGDSGRRRAVLDDWRLMDFARGAFDAAVGDGSLTVLEYPQDQGTFYDRLAHVLRPGGVFAARVFCAPDEPETVRSIDEDALAGRIGSFHAYKWRFAMCIAAARGDINLVVRNVRDEFERQHPDRDEFAKLTGWSREDIDTIDAYEKSATTYCFLTREQLASVIPDRFTGVTFVPSGTYELAERCPLLVARLRD
jgi:SAM-dependent methyltransferase